MELTLAPPFGSHMVLQRGRQNPLWGWDRPGQSITVTIESGSADRPRDDRPIVLYAEAARERGEFRVELPELPSQGPYRIRVRGSREQVLEDVLVGDVWLASGQSNMEWTVAQSAGADEEIAAARHPNLRCLYVTRTPAKTAARTVEASWRVVSPETVGSMTAVGYFFAREIARRLEVPIGIIDASWGGTPIESWTSVEALRPSMPEVDEKLADLAIAEADLPRIRSEYAARLARWEAAHLPADPGNRGEALGWAERDFDASSWKELSLPAVWQHHGMKFNGVVWFRRTIEIPEAFAGHDLILSLGAIDDFDHTYFDGRPIGAHPKGTAGAHQIHRRYRIPGELVLGGTHVVAVRVFDHFGEGGFLGPASAMFAETAAPGGERIPLAGPWRVEVEQAIDLVPGNVFASYPQPPPVLQPHYAPGALMNGMIAPLVPFGLKGFLFYQGESNVGAHATYRARMIALIRDLRTRFAGGLLPFYFVQLAAFTADDGWPMLREAQAAALSEPATGMATAIDIGEPHDIHPRNKRDVGRRLAFIALRQAYGLPEVEASGPLLSRIEIARGEVRVHFAHAEGLSTSDGAARVGGFELAGTDLRFQPAEARIDGSTVIVRSPAVPRPAAVRYAFRDCPAVNLVNRAGLPAYPFRTDGA